MDELLEKLRKSGLTGNESKVYLELLRKNESSANELSKIISMDRTLIYTVLNHLIEKGLVNYITKQNKKFFSAADPENLLNPVKAQEIFVKGFIQQLKEIETYSETSQEINIYEGKEGIRTLWRLIMKYQEVVSFGATGRAYDMLYESPNIAKEIEKRGCTGKIITSTALKNHPMKIKTFKMKFLDIKSEATTTIFGNYVSIHLIKNKPIIILIKNKEIAESYRNHFEILWQTAKK